MLKFGEIFLLNSLARFFYFFGKVDTFWGVWRDFSLNLAGVNGTYKKYKNGGDVEIRTLDKLAPIHGFQPCSLNHSDTSPARYVRLLLPLNMSMKKHRKKSGN